MERERLDLRLTDLLHNRRLLDESQLFPREILDALHDCGLLIAPLPRTSGGEGIGTEPEQADAANRLLQALGCAWLPLARVFEGHLNALRLLNVYGRTRQREVAAANAHAGNLFAIWAAERTSEPVRIEHERLVGKKTFASGAGIVTRAIVTARNACDQEIMVLADVSDARIGDKVRLHGMGGAGTAAVDLTGIAAPESAIVGEPNDYMRQPEISLGAWRPLAIMAGALQALVAALKTELRRQGRDGDPLQRARFAACLVARETAALWAAQAAREAERADAGEREAAYVKLARLAVDEACVTVVNLAQRSVGLAGFVVDHPLESLIRNLITYMRQPALDASLDEASAYFLAEGSR